MNGVPNGNDIGLKVGSGVYPDPFCVTLDRFFKVLLRSGLIQYSVNSTK